MGSSLTNRIIKLGFDNFTPLQRTPWAGSGIIKHLKADLLDPSQQDLRVGECWEVSCDKSFASKLSSDDTLALQEFILANLDFALGNAKAAGTSEILLKTLHADKPLSLQVHPEDSYTKLESFECGKPESWYVLAAEEGAGLYLGLSEKVSKDSFRSRIASSDSLLPLLNFVPVMPGDYFEIEPGVLHAVGPGVLLLEPQRLRRGQSGKTYRVWDWNRKYDSAGNENKDG